MHIGGKIIAAGMALALAACASAPAAPTVPPTDASFAWGCWVSKDEPGGRITGFLRLLKDGADGKLYEGYLHDVRGSDMIPLLHLAITRDGSRAVVVREGQTTDFTSNATRAGITADGRRTLDFRGAAGGVFMSGNNDQLSLAIQIGPDAQTYEFERDGCD